MSFKLVILSLFSLVCSAVCSAQQRYLTFGADTDSVQSPAQVPAEALARLTSDKEDFPHGPPERLRCSDHEKYPTTDREQEEQILCTTVHLSSSSGTNYLVIGVGALRGAHIVPFWIVHQSVNGPVVLFKTRSDALTILSTTHNGYSDLESTWLFGDRIDTTRYRFDGKAYKRFSSRETRN